MITLLTGATGHVGGALLPRLLDGPGDRVIALLRARDAAHLQARAEALRRDAEELLKQYSARKDAAEAEAARIVEQAKADADSMRREAERQLAADLQRRERQVEERIARAEQAAAAEVRSVAADAAIAAAENLLRGPDGAAAHGRLVGQGAVELAERFR